MPFVLNTIKISSEENDKEKWFIDPHPFRCILCWEYKEEEDEENIEEGEEDEIDEKNETEEGEEGEYSAILKEAKKIGVIKRKNCYHYYEDFCRYWRFKEDPNLITMNPNDLPFILDLTKFPVNGEEKWFFNPHPFYCLICGEHAEWNYDEKNDE